ncbi:MAG: endopeptidase [Betaproteobacteria bacterium]|nr:endopeptidase [Betaproteobacteria bacterium]
MTRKNSNKIANGQIIDSDSDQLITPSFMVETNNGGRVEQVPGFNTVLALASGFKGGRVPPRLRDPRLGSANDIAFATPEFTFGQDDRQQIHDTTQLPWRCICHIVMEGSSGRMLKGTGWLAGPKTVFTAGHNLFSSMYNHETTRVWVMPARSGDAVPFGYEISTSFGVHPKWKSDGDPNYDLGVIWLSGSLGELGSFGFAAWPDQQLTNLIVNNSGYPDDKPMGTQWFNAGRILELTPNTVTYGLDTEPGQSGSPVFYFDKNMNRIVVAVHAYGSNQNNIGVRITPEIYSTLSAWRR